MSEIFIYWIVFLDFFLQGDFASWSLTWAFFLVAAVQVERAEMVGVSHAPKNRAVKSDRSWTAVSLSPSRKKAFVYYLICSLCVLLNPTLSNHIKIYQYISLHKWVEQQLFSTSTLIGFYLGYFNELRSSVVSVWNPATKMSWWNCDSLHPDSIYSHYCTIFNTIRRQFCEFVPF